MELRTAILQTSSSLPPRFHNLKPTSDFAFASPFNFFVTNSLRPSFFAFLSKDQQHFFPATACDTAVLNRVSDRLSCTGASSGDCSCDDPRDSNEQKDDDMGFLDNYEMIIRDCDKLIESFIAVETDWRRLLVFNKKWNNIRPHFFIHCQDKADAEDNPVIKNKLLWLGKNVKEIDEELQRHNELIEIIRVNPSETSEIVSRSRKDFNKEFFMHLRTIAESYDDDPETQNDRFSHSLSVPNEHNCKWSNQYDLSRSSVHVKTSRSN